jgi:hypothetical protein
MDHFHPFSISKVLVYPEGKSEDVHGWGSEVNGSILYNEPGFTDSGLTLYHTIYFWGVPFLGKHSKLSIFDG